MKRKPWMAFVKTFSYIGTPVIFFWLITPKPNATQQDDWALHESINMRNIVDISRGLPPEHRTISLLRDNASLRTILTPTGELLLSKRPTLNARVISIDASHLVIDLRGLDINSCPRYVMESMVESFWGPAHISTKGHAKIIDNAHRSTDDENMRLFHMLVESCENNAGMTLTFDLPNH